MTSRKTCDMPHVECIVIDEDTVRFGGSDFRRVRTCHAVRHEVDITGMNAVIWMCSECDDYISLAHNYCSNCGAKVMDE